MILIFGGSGFIGTHFTNYLLKKKINFAVVIKNKKKITKNSYIINTFDYNNITNAIVKYKPKVIINFHG
jgi:nucleoside-diphosphate-sugar epimerase